MYDNLCYRIYDVNKSQEYVSSPRTEMMYSNTKNFVWIMNVQRVHLF